MFILELYDRNGTKLNIGDIVKVSDGRYFNFYAEVKYLEEEEAITPFHTFSFHSFEKVEKVPDNAIKSKEERYNIWYIGRDSAEEDREEIVKQAEKYLMDWRHCEHLLNENYFKIKQIEARLEKI